MQYFWGQGAAVEQKQRKFLVGSFIKTDHYEEMGKIMLSVPINLLLMAFHLSI
jgi:hypothetical protein